VLVGIKALRDAGLAGVAISGNHDTPRVRGTGSPYAALEEIFGGVTFAWAMEGRSADLAGVRFHAVPQALSVPDFRAELGRAAERTSADTTNVLLAHVALTSLPAGSYPDINELEIEEGAFDKRFDLVLLGHYHAFQKASRRTWYAGSTDTFSFADSPQVPKGIVVLDTDARTVRHVENPSARPLATVSVPSSGLSAGELVAAVERLSSGAPDGGIVRVYLNEVDPAAYRQVANEQFQEAVPGALFVQVQPDFGAKAMTVQGGPTIGSLEQEWSAFVELQDLSGLDRARIVALGVDFLEGARGETV